MEEAGVVTSEWEESPQGPRRRKYLLNQSLSITFDLAPHLFTTKIQSYSPTTQSKKIHAETESLLKRIEEIRQSPDEKTRIGIARKLLENIDEKIRNLEEERVLLLHIRNIAMQEASEAITTLQMEKEGRRILLRILDEHDLNVEGISRALNLREGLVRQILAEFE
jgi:predicted transcriptional regulator